MIDQNSLKIEFKKNKLDNFLIKALKLFFILKVLNLKIRF